ncbi:MAG: PrsW family glutamic-type intramembrane protease [Candidatus Gracilibacteria bacterium]|nr:PrsW family glutamic-type intramembrane protease [Candidatus Gracilibacteria bacterium]
MLTSLLNISLIALISLIPIVIWAYIFSYIDDSSLNKKRFLVGVIGGGLSVLPILYMDKIVSLINFEYLNTFAFAYRVRDFFSSLEFAFSLELFLLILVLFSFVLGVFVHKFNNIMKVYLKNLIVFLVLVFLVSSFTYLLSFFGNSFEFLNMSINSSIAFGSIVFDSLRLIIFYYLIVAFIEESSKHFNFLQSSVLHIDSIKTGVLYAIFVALGFSLIENILYFYNIYSQLGLGRELVSTYFFRSIFSVMVHVFCSSVVAYYFSKALLLYREKDLSFPYLKIFLYGLFLAIAFHLVFDVALTLGFSFIIILYLVGGYLYVGSVFYRE